MYKAGKVAEVVVASIMNADFWAQLEALIKCLLPMYTAQLQSEADNSKLGKTVNRWKQLEHDLQKLSARYPSYLSQLMAAISGLFYVHSRKQLQLVHYAALLLQPVSIMSLHTTDEVKMCEQWLIRHCKTDDTKYVIKSWIQYRAQEADFTK